MSHPLRHGRVRVPVLVGLLAAALAQPTLASAQDAADPTPTCAADAAPQVLTDRPIYDPSETVQITGEGYVPNCDVTVEVEQQDAEVKTFETSTDADGELAEVYTADDTVGTATVRVRDTASDRVMATAAFGILLSITSVHDGDDEADSVFRPGQTIHVSGRLDGFARYRWVVKDPAGNPVVTTSCSTRDSNVYEAVSTTYQLPASAGATGNAGWRVELHQYTDTWFGSSAEEKCAARTGADVASRRVSVTDVRTFADKAGTQERFWFKPNQRAWVALRGLTPRENNWTVSWIKPDGTTSCRNGNLGDRPDTDNNGVLPILAYAPFTTNDEPAHNRLSAYWWAALPGDRKCVDTTLPGTWKVVVDDNGDNRLEYPAFGIDGLAPTITAEYATGWQSTPVTVTLKPEERGPSGLDKVEYAKSPSGPWTAYDDAAKPKLNHGEKLYYRASDKAGNVTEDETGTAQVDGEKPTTVASGFTAGWQNADQTITLTATDAGPSGVAKVEYRKAGTTDWLTYDAAAKPVLAHGQTLEFFATDVAGNAEAVQQVGPAQVDGEKPTTVASGFTAGWQNAAQTIELTATDAGPSGVAKVEYRKAGTTDWTTYDAASKPVLNDGETLEFFATDAAGNAETVKQVGPAQVDTNAPVTTATFSTDWSNGPVPVTLTATDIGSGVERIEYRKPGAATWSTYDAAAKPTLADGESFQFRAVDAVGNEEATKSTANAKVDTDAPTTTAMLATGWQTASVPVRLVATDAKSGIAKIEHRVAGTAAWSTYDDAARPALAHGQTLEFRATDKVGNTEVTKVTAAAQVDGQAPTTTDDVPAGEVDGPTAVTLTAADAGPSGVAKVEWRKVGGSTWTVYAANAKPVLADGERLEYRATDVAGNAEAIKQSAALKVKVAPPVTGTDTSQNAPVVSASSASRTALPTVTNLAIAPACMVGLTLDAPTAGRKAVSLSYVLGGGATQVEITIQKRDPSAARKTCAATNNVRKPGAKYETVDQQKVAGKDGSASSDIGSHDETATARAAKAKASKTVKKIVARQAAVAGRNRVTLAKLASGKQLAAGTYRVLVVAIDASGRRSAPAKAVFRVVSGS